MLLHFQITEWHCAEVRNFTLFVPTPKAGLLPEATFVWGLSQVDNEVSFREFFPGDKVARGTGFNQVIQ